MWYLIAIKPKTNILIIWALHEKKPFVRYATMCDTNIEVVINKHWIGIWSTFPLFNTIFFGNNIWPFVHQLFIDLITEMVGSETNRNWLTNGKMLYECFFANINGNSDWISFRKRKTVQIRLSETWINAAGIQLNGYMLVTSIWDSIRLLISPEAKIFTFCRKASNINSCVSMQRHFITSRKNIVALFLPLNGCWWCLSALSMPKKLVNSKWGDRDFSHLFFGRKYEIRNNSNPLHRISFSFLLTF